jgi:S-adenosylmethionine hydrolase
LGNHTIQGLSDAYADVPPGSPLAIIGSLGFLELVVNRGNASRFFNASIGDRVEFFFSPRMSL